MPQKTFISLRWLNYLLCAGFFLTGIATVLIGQVLPVLAQKLNINDAAAGYFFIAQFAGSICGTVVTTWFARRSEFLTACILGLISIAAGVLCLNFDVYALCLAGFFLLGVGVGVTLPAINLLTLEINWARAAAALNVLNFYWGVGAILSQPLIDVLISGTSLVVPTVSLTFALAAVAAIFYVLPADTEKEFGGGEKAIENTESAEEPNQPHIWTHPLAWAIALFNFVHVGFESGMSGWLKTFAARVEYENGVSPNLASPILLYFVLFVAGRGAAPIFLRFLSVNKLLLLNLLAVLIGTILILSAADVAVLSFGAAIAGFGTSSIFPTNLSRFSQIFGAAARTRATPLFVCGTVGAAATTWTIGVASDYFKSLRSGMLILLASVLILIALQIFLTFWKKPAN